MSGKSFWANFAGRIRGQKPRTYRIKKVVSLPGSGSVLIQLEELPTMEETSVTLSIEEVQYLARAFEREQIDWLPGQKFSINGQTPGEYFLSLISEIGE